MNCAEHNKWTKAEKLVYLHSSLDKDVANVLWDYDKDVTNSLSGLTKILESRYGGKSFADKHRIELRNRRRKKGESISNLHVDIRRLAALAFPKVERKARESIACDHFLDALDDPELALKIRERQPSDLDAALRIALQLEVWTTDTTRLKEAKSDRVERRVCEISHQSEPTKDTVQEMEKRIAELENRLAKANYNGYQPPSTYGTNRGINRNRYTNASSNLNSYANSNLTCYRCGTTTHLVRNCPFLHLVRNCPLAGTDERTPRVDSRSLPSQQKQQNVRPIEGRSNRPNKACIWIKYRQYKLSALLDTGSDVSIAGEEVAERLGWQIATHHIKQVNVANNEPMCMIGAAYVDLNVGGRIVESEILITPDIRNLILGLDWLRQQGRFQWDFEKGRIRFVKEDWIELWQENHSIRRIRPELSDIKEENESFNLSATDNKSNCVSVLNEQSVCTNSENSISTSNSVGGK